MGDSAYGELFKKLNSPTKKRDSKRYIYEQRNIIEQRHTYLQTIKKLRRENKTIIYTDETWVNAHHTLKNTSGWTVMEGVDGRYQVGKAKD